MSLERQIEEAESLLRQHWDKEMEMKIQMKHRSIRDALKTKNRQIQQVLKKIEDQKQRVRKAAEMMHYYNKETIELDKKLKEQIDLSVQSLRMTFKKKSAILYALKGKVMRKNEEFMDVIYYAGRRDFMNESNLVPYKWKVD